ncbi:MAG: hypothetical protein K9N23_04100 [Akkermansiaceae bacterium]|nr:hypothetical protein [Akkermansiaceae bacterium]
MKSSPFLPLVLALLLEPHVGECATSVSIHWYNDFPNGTELTDIDRTPLTTGTENGGDGAVLQLGYYTSGSSANPFSGDWVPLTGPGSDPLLSTTIGDTIWDVPGKFNITTGFKSDYPNVPPSGTPLAIRFYDSTSLPTANYFNAVSNTDGTWDWTTTAPSATMTLAIRLSTATQVWQGGADSAFRTTIPVPEPSTLWLLANPLWFVLRRRRSDGR